MKDLRQRQKIQEEEYVFFYHYISTYEGESFCQTLSWSWGYQYLSAVQFILDKIRELGFESLLDVGCGDGRFLHEAKKAYPDKELLGVDYSERAIALAKALNPDIPWMARDISKGQIVGSFDIVTLIEVLEHISPADINSFISGIHENLKENGYLILTVPSKNKPLNPKHFQHFDLNDLRELLESSFSIHEVYYFRVCQGL